jgi:hypothetical protein
MPSEKFAQRLKALEESRAPVKRESDQSVVERLLAFGMSLVASAVCFLVLKGLTLAYFGPVEFAALTSSLGPLDTNSTLGLWVTGIDPVSQAIADFFEPTFRS